MHLISKENSISINGIDIYYKIIGEGTPVIILHGGPGFDHIHMLPFTELATDFKVIFYDQRATGKSSGNVDPHSITVNNFVEDLEGLRKTLDLKKINIIGHSWGAVLALHYAVKYPDRLNNLVLLAAYASAEIFGAFFENVQKRTSPDDNIIIKKIEQSEKYKNNEPSAMQKHLKISLKPFFHDPSLVDRLDLKLSGNTALNQTSVSELLMQDLGNFNLHEKLQVINSPTLIVHGNFDPIPMEGPSKIHQYISASKLVIIENAGHFMFIESPDETFKVIRDFFKDNKKNKFVLE